MADRRKRRARTGPMAPPRLRQRFRPCTRKDMLKKMRAVAAVLMVVTVVTTTVVQGFGPKFPAWPSRAGLAPDRLMMAGFGGGQAEKPKETPKSLTSGEAVARTALKEYNDLKKEGGVVAQVYARQKDTDDEWLPVGYVCTEAGKTAEGIQGQKRLIMEHALEIHDDLKSAGSKKLVLEAGYSIGEEGEVILSKAKYNGEKVGVALDPRPTGPYFRNVGPGGFAKDTSSSATLADRAKFK